MSDLLTVDTSHPIRIVNNGDLKRSRLTVFFRMLLAFPHYFWLMLFGIAAMFVLCGAWFVGLVRGRVPEGMHGFLGRYIRYSLYVSAYAGLAADPFPPFNGAPGGYPIDLEIDPPAQQSRVTIFFRYLLAFPALIISAVLSYLVYVVGFFGWFYAMFTGRMSPGMERVLLYGLRYNAQTNAYVYLLTGRYPSL